MLLVSQKNEIYALIEEAGFSPAQFRFDEVPSSFNAVPRVMKLIYLAQPEYSFRFDRRARRELHYVSYSPGLYDLIDEANPGADWFMVKAYVKEWLQNLARELDQPDRWKSMAVVLQESDIPFYEKPEDASPFSVPEYKQLCDKLDEAVARLPEAGLEETEIEVIRLRFERLKEKAASMSRGDWRSLFLGSMVGLVSSLGLSAGTVRALWELLRQVFHNLLLP
ncbi:MAG: hypothetical protein R3B47_17790 [Bacteroidia bacterium]